MAALNKEVAFFEKHRQEFLQKALGKFALVKGEKLHGFFDTDEAAYKAGVEAFSLEPFLIRQVLEEDQIHEVPALSVKVIHASV